MRKLLLLFYLSLFIQVSLSTAQEDQVRSYETSSHIQNKLLVNARAAATVYSNFASLNGNLNFGLEKFSSDINQQSLFAINFSTTRYAHFPRRSLFPINFSLNANYRKKVLFKKNVFLLLNPTLNINRIVDTDRTSFFPVVRVGVGKGRIDRVTEKFVAESLIHQLSFAADVNKEITNELSLFIRELKNRRNYFNLGNIDKELSELADYLIARGITNDQINDEVNIQLIKKIYKVLPSLDRTSGREYGLTGILGTRYTHFNGDEIFDLWRTFGQTGFTLYYNDNKYVNRKFQLNKRIGLSAIWLENFDQGYSMTEHISVEAIAFPQIDISYGIQAGVFNRFHTLKELRSYGLELGGHISKIFSQRCFLNVNLLANIDFNQNVSGNLVLSLNI